MYKLNPIKNHALLFINCMNDKFAPPNINHAL